MKAWKLATTVAVAAVLAAGVAANSEIIAPKSPAMLASVADRAEDFRLVDQNSRAHLLTYYKHAPAIVIVSYTNASAQMNDAALSLRNLHASFKDSGVQLFLLSSNPGLKRETIIADMKALMLGARGSRTGARGPG